MALGTFRDGAPKLLWGRGVIHRAVQITSGKAFQYSKCDLSATGDMQMHVGTDCTLVPWEKKKKHTFLCISCMHGIEKKKVR